MNTTPPKKSNTGYKVFFTSYNPEKEQTDNAPCVGASGRDLCKLYNERPIALDRALVSRTGSTPFHYGDIVRLDTVEGTAGHNDPRCSGVFVVHDTMNSRFTGKNRGDIFFLQRKDNISCFAVISKVK